ncbi:MAG TPA: OmpA family protein, partial [Polyangiaceae bacterium]
PPADVASAGGVTPETQRPSDTPSGPHGAADVPSKPSPATSSKPGESQPRTSPTASLAATLKVSPAAAEKIRENQSAIGKDVAKPVAPNVRITEIIFFNSGSSKISSPTLPLIDQVARTILANPDTTVFVQGHTSVEEATTLAQQRANSVYQSLVSRGVPREQLMITSLGNTQPIADNATENGREKNRRVSFMVTK